MVTDREALGQRGRGPFGWTGREAVGAAPGGWRIATSAPQRWEPRGYRLWFRTSMTLTQRCTLGGGAARWGAHTESGPAGMWAAQWPSWVT